VKRIIVPVFLILALMVTFFPVPVSANSPAPSPWFCFFLSNLPKGTKYVDLLTLLPTSDPMYTELNAESIPEGFAEDAEIFAFCEDDYRSYTFHYADAVSEITIDSHDAVYFFADKDYIEDRYEHMERVSQSGKIRLAMLDASGNILKVSPVLEVRPRDFMTYPTGYFFYDGTTDGFQIDAAGAGFGRVLYAILCFAGMVLTCFVERLVAIPFKLKKQYGRLILLTNVSSQLLMYAGYALLYSMVFWKYSVATIVLEILIYLGEYLVYRQKMRDVPKLKSFAYAVAANTASLVIGLTIL